MWLLAGPRKCNWPSVKFWSVFQNPVTFIHNCCVNEEHKIKGELILNESSDAEKQIIRDTQKVRNI